MVNTNHVLVDRGSVSFFALLAPDSPLFEPGLACMGWNGKTVEWDRLTSCDGPQPRDAPAISGKMFLSVSSMLSSSLSSSALSLRCLARSYHSQPSTITPVNGNVRAI